MPSIPVLPDQFIPDVSEKVSNAQVINSAIGLGEALTQEELKFKNARDTTKVNEQYAKFQTEIQAEYDNLKLTHNDPETFSKTWNDYYNTKKKEYAENPELSRNAKNSLTNILNRYQATNADNVIKTQRQLQVDSYANNIENTAISNNMLAYRAGQNLNMNALKQSERIIDANVIAGSTIVSGEKLEESKRTQVQGIYVNFIKGTVETDLNYAKRLIEDKDIQDKLVDLETINKLRKYIGDVEKEQETREKDLKKATLNVEVQTDLQSQYDNFDIGFKLEEGEKTGRDVIKNEDMDNIESLIDFREQVKDAYEKKQITDAQYRNWIAKTTSVFVGKIREDELGYGGFPMLTSVNEQLTVDLNKQLKDNPNINDTEFVGIYENTVKQLQSGNYSNSIIQNVTGDERAKAEPINLNASWYATNEKLIAQEVLKQNIEKYNQLKTNRNNAQTVIMGDKILPLNSQAKNQGQQLDNGGWEVKEQNGYLFDVRYDNKGNVLEWRAR